MMDSGLVSQDYLRHHHHHHPPAIPLANVILTTRNSLDGIRACQFELVLRWKATSDVCAMLNRVVLSHAAIVFNV